MSGRSVKVNLSEQASEDLKSVAKELGLSETDVIRKGLLIMGLYSKLRKDREGSLILKKGNEQRELLIV